MPERGKEKEAFSYLAFYEVEYKLNIYCISLFFSFSLSLSLILFKVLLPFVYRIYHSRSETKIFRIFTIIQKPHNQLTYCMICRKSNTRSFECKIDELKKYKKSKKQAPQILSEKLCDEVQTDQLLLWNLL